MQHIEVTGYGAVPCQGEVREVAVEQPARPRSLPIYQSGGGSDGPARAWECTRCGKRWTREPLPDEAL